jgi:lysophospholipase L1-like esterase
VTPPARAGLVAVGDSITRGTGTAVLGVTCLSWAQWLAEALELPFTNLAADGATVGEVLARQLPRVRDGYAVGAVYAGVNDVRSVDFDADAFARDLERVVAHVAAHAERLVLCTIPLDLGRPRAGATKVRAANEIIRAVAARHDAAVAALEDLSGPTLVQPDAVHPTARGLLEIADRAAAVLGAPLPSRAAEVRRGPRALARFLLTTHLPAVARDGRRRVREDLQRRLGR